ncbi:MAG: fasciclin domain-containing protein, partial [Bacteroidales bacterium]|nr:fasciclin domain-containing protein [Bacteroidales bacterium]MBN2697607.1 fasciclin domain-containing protein [Bacteroidales bacterium]
DPTGQLAQILLYHVVGAKAMSTDLSNGQTITTLQGSDITVTIQDSKVYINDVEVLVADLEADNGVVHVIDAVLLPPTSTGSLNKITNSVGSVTIYPNPARERFNIQFDMAEKSLVTLEMYDMLGQRIKTLDQGYLYDGSYSVEVPVGDLETGMYIMIVNTGNTKIANKVRVVK